MRGTVKWRGSKHLTRRRRVGVVLCTSVHDNARVPPSQVTTSDYPEEARLRLGVAVTRARESAGWMRRGDLAERAKVSVRSLVKLEKGGADPGVGRQVLEAVGRILPHWTEDTPWDILAGGPIPLTVDEEIAAIPPDPEPVEPVEYWTAADETFMQALTEILKPQKLKPTRDIVRAMRREWEQRQSQTDGDESNEVG